MKKKKNKTNNKGNKIKKDTVQLELMGNRYEKNLKIPITHYPIDFNAIYCPHCGSGNVIKKATIEHRYRDPSQIYYCKKEKIKFLVDPNFGFQYPLFIIDQILDLFVQGCDAEFIVVRVIKDAKSRGLTITITKQSILNIVRRACKLLSEFEFILYHEVTSDEWQIDDCYQKVPKKRYLEQKITLSELERKKKYKFVHAYITNVLAVKTRYWLAAPVTLNRDTCASITALNIGWNRSKYQPEIIRSDAWQPHVKGAHSIFPNADIEVRSKEEDKTWTCYIESMNRTMRKGPLKKGLCFQKIELLQASADLTRIWYDFLKIHSELGKTPAQAAGITIPFKGWDDLLRYAYYITRYVKFIG